VNNLRGWVKRLERGAGEHEHTLTMPDGAKVNYTGEEMFEAVIAALREEDHRLLPYIREMDANKEGIANLLGALEGTNDDHRAGASE
jgi:hypothetical protein